MSEAARFEPLSPAGLLDGKMEDNAPVNVDAILQSILGRAAERFGMAAAVLIDASIIRMILVPAVMSLLGRHAWWIPRWLDRIMPNLDIEGSAHLARVSQQEEAALAGGTPTH